MALNERVSALCVVTGENAGQVLSTVLELGGLKDIFLTDDVSATLRMIGEKNVNIVLIEDSLPHLDGVRLIREIRKSPESPDIKVPILLTLQAANQQRILDASNAGVNEIMMCPFTPTKLYDRVGRAIHDTRKFIVSDGYVGPDRRVLMGARFKGRDRRNRPPQRTAANPAATVEVVQL